MQLDPLIPINSLFLKMGETTKLISFARMANALFRSLRL